MSDVDVLILGAGPTGLGAATQIERLRSRPTATPTYLIVDARPVPGGWAGSVTTPEQFIFDFGGHVLHPHRH
jgi:protoporphyrinogen oxidase